MVFFYFPFSIFHFLFYYTRPQNLCIFNTCFSHTFIIFWYIHGKFNNILRQNITYFFCPFIVEKFLALRTSFGTSDMTFPFWRIYLTFLWMWCRCVVCYIFSFIYWVLRLLQADTNTGSKEWQSDELNKERNSTYKNIQTNKHKWRW